MSILIGGNFASGAMRGWDYQSAVLGLNDRLKLVTVPTFGTVFQAHTSQRDYADAASYRSELSQPSTVNQWGRTFLAAWRVIIPPDWVLMPDIVNTVVLQMHDINAASVVRGPSFAGEIIGGTLYLKLCHDGFPNGDVLGGITISPGQEISVWLRVRWADGTNEPLANGFAEAYINGQLTGQRTGRNHWATVDPNPPYMKSGVYVPTTNIAWAGKSRTLWTRGAVLADGGESFDALDALIYTQTVRAVPQVQGRWPGA